MLLTVRYAQGCRKMTPWMSTTTRQIRSTHCSVTPVPDLFPALARRSATDVEFRWKTETVPSLSPQYIVHSSPPSTHATVGQTSIHTPYVIWLPNRAGHNRRRAVDHASQLKRWVDHVERPTGNMVVVVGTYNTPSLLLLLRKSVSSTRPRGPRATVVVLKCACALI